MKQLEKFDKTHAEAMETIKQYLEPYEQEPKMHLLVRWMLETDANPYGYLQEAWATSTYSSTGFASLLSVISHAVLDDGDITFVAVNGEPRIVFAHKYDDWFENAVLSTSEKALRSSGIDVMIEVLDIEPNEFGALYDEYLKSCS